MNNKGLSLAELLLVIVIMGVLATFSTISINRIIVNASEKVDEYNVVFIGEAINTAFLEGNIIIKNNRLHNTESNRSYSGTGSWFVEDMEDYIGSRIVPIHPDAQNRHNLDSGDGVYKLWFQVREKDMEFDIYYWDEDRNKVVLTTIELG